jgi:2-oxoisovalerate dehydrogenase E1 component
VLFVCENNLYATEVPYASVTKNPHPASRAAAYGLPGVEVDGNDVTAVHRAAGEAVRRAREGRGPTLLECRTYRIRAHCEGMREAGYRTPEEIAAWKERDPIRACERLLVDGGMASRADLDAVDAEVRALVEEAAAFALASPMPDPATVADHVYSAQREAPRA